MAHDDLNDHAARRVLDHMGAVEIRTLGRHPRDRERIKREQSDIEVRP